MGRNASPEQAEVTPLLPRFTETFMAQPARTLRSEKARNHHVTMLLERQADTKKNPKSQDVYEIVVDKRVVGSPLYIEGEQLAQLVFQLLVADLSNFMNDGNPEKAIRRALQRAHSELKHSSERQ